MPAAFEAHLAALADALAAGEAGGIEAAAQALHRKVHEALKRGAPTLAGADLATLRHLSAQTAALREAVCRAQAQTQHGLAALLPQALAGALYGASGHAQGPRSQGLAQA